MLPRNPIGAFFFLFWGKLRRWWLTNFRPGYVRAQQMNKRGACLQCGKCCRLPYRCPMLTRDNKCRVYNLARTASCRLFPLNPRDLGDIDGKCGYYFVDGTGSTVS